jgi:hypothetical protein
MEKVIRAENLPLSQGGGLKLVAMQAETPPVWNASRACIDDDDNL